MPEKIYPPMSARELRNAALSRKAAAESMLLLKNDHAALPLAGKKVALFGSGAVRTVRGGTGSGDPFNGGLSGGGDNHVDASPRYHIYAYRAFLDAGWEVLTERDLLAYAAEYDNARHGAAASPLGTFAYPDQTVSAAMAARYASQTDTAVYVLSRNSGEGSDRDLIKKGDIGDYLLSGREQQNLQNLRAAFKRVVLVLNVGGIVDLTRALEIGVDAILLMGQAGQEGGAALVDVLTGQVNPSGKLTDSWAKKYSDYPASATFALNDGDSRVEQYAEGIYVGYRYFDAFGIDPLYPFGFGLSYTSFTITPGAAELSGETLRLKAAVTNVGAVSGKEVVQLYCSAPDGRLEMPVQELCGFTKTGQIEPGGSETVTLCVNVRDLASFDAGRECFVLQSGEYILRIGNSSRSTVPICVLCVPKDTATRYRAALLPPPGPFEELSRAGETPYVPGGGPADVPVLTLGDLAAEPMPDYTREITTYTTDPAYKAVMPYEKVELIEKRNVTFSDVTAGRAQWKDLVAQISNAGLSMLNCGTGWGVTGEHDPIVGANSKTVRGAAGETTPFLAESFGIPSIVVADGPAGIRVAQNYEARNVDTGEMVQVYRYCTAWPVGTLLAQSFDLPLLREIGAALAEELKEMGVHILLGPGMNIHRDPLCGRNFEYFSEDPFVSGKCAAAITQGVQSFPGVGTCIKHFAANNQETSRNSTDSRIGPRALREIYLRGFEIAVRESQPLSIMTAYNHVCSVPCGDSFELCTMIARDEWGFEGLLMTDWNGGCSTAWKSMHGGNDLIMPGGTAKSDEILLALEPAAPEFDGRGQVAGIVSGPFPLPHLRWNAFTVAADGPDTVTAPIAEGHSAGVAADGKILVDGAPVFLSALTFYDLIRMHESGEEPENPNFLTGPVTTECAQLSEDGRAIVYRGYMRRDALICRGDLQRCAIHNLQIIARCQA